MWTENERAAATLRKSAEIRSAIPSPLLRLLNMSILEGLCASAGCNKLK